MSDLPQIPKCPKCKSEGYEYKISDTDRILYRCKKCHWRYNNLSNTFLRGSRLSDEEIKILYAMLYGPTAIYKDDGKLNISHIAKQLHITRRTIYRYKKLFDPEQQEN